VRATLLVCTVHFVQCFVCSARHMHKPHHAQANPCTCNSQEGMHCIVLVAVCFWALFTLCTSYVVYSSQCAMLRVLGVHCANVVRFAVCRMFQCPVCFVHKQALLTQTVCNVRAANKVCIAQYARCALCKCRVRFAVCRVFQCPGCLVHKLCTVPPHPCAMSVYLVGCAMLGVHSENSPHPKCKLLLNAHAHSHPPSSCAQCVLCTLCALYPPAMGPAVAPRSRRSPAKCVVIV